jgi:hypothetical protein
LGSARAASPNPFQKLDGFVNTLESSVNGTRDTTLPALKANVESFNNLYYYNTSRWGSLPPCLPPCCGNAAGQCRARQSPCRR